MEKTEEQNMYEILGKMYVHYVADQNLPISPNKFYSMVPSIAKSMDVNREDVEQAFIFLAERAIEVGLNKKRNSLGFNFPKK